MARDVIHEAILSLRADTAQLRTDLQQGKSIFGGGLKDMQGLARTLAPVLSIGGVAAFIGNVVNIGDQLSDLADQTGHSVEVLGGLKPILDRNGSSIEGFARSTSIAQRNLGDLSKDTAAFLKQLGVNVGELKAAAPDEFIEKLSRSLATIEDRNQRAAAAAKILGRSYAELGPTILEVAENGLPKLSEATAQAYKDLGKFKDALVIVIAQLTNLVALAAGGYATLGKLFGLIDLSKAEQFGKAALQIETLTAAVERSTRVSKERIEGMGLAELEELAKKAPPAAVAAITALTRARQEFEKFRDFTEKPAGAGAAISIVDDAAQKKVEAFVKSLESQADALRVNIEELRGGSLAAKSLGLDIEFAGLKGAMSAGQFAKLKGEILELSRAFARAKLDADVLKQSLETGSEEPMMPAEIVAALSGRAKSVGGGILSPEDLKIVNEEDAKQLAELARMWEQDSAEMAAAADLLKAKIGTELTAALATVAAEAQVFGDRFDETSAKIDAFKNAIQQLIAEGLSPLDPQIQELKTQLEGLEATRDLEQGFRDLAQSISAAFDATLNGIMQGTQTFGEGMQNLFRNIVLSIAKTILELAVIKPFEKWLEQELASIWGMLNGQGGGGGVASGLLGLFGGGIGGFFGGFGGGSSFAGIGSGAAGGLASFPLTLDSGGIVTRPTIARLAMNGRPEAVIPLDQMDSAGPTRMVKPTVIIHGGIVPQSPFQKADDIVQVVIQDMDADGKIRRAFRRDLGA